MNCNCMGCAGEACMCRTAEAMYESDMRLSHALSQMVRTPVGPSPRVDAIVKEQAHVEARRRTVQRTREKFEGLKQRVRDQFEPRGVQPDRAWR